MNSAVLQDIRLSADQVRRMTANAKPVHETKLKVVKQQWLSDMEVGDKLEFAMKKVVGVGNWATTYHLAEQIQLEPHRVGVVLFRLQNAGLPIQMRMLTEGAQWRWLLAASPKNEK